MPGWNETPSVKNGEKWIKVIILVLTILFTLGIILEVVK